jgi:imidazolonepropionase-like amidohydrolase
MTGNRERPTMHRLLLLVVVSSLAPVRYAGAEVLAIRGARIYRVNGGGPEGTLPRGTVLVENGKIRAVGESIAIPPEARVIEASGRVVMPGIVDANARFGLRGASNEQASEITPQVRAACLLNPRSPEFRRALQAGVTSACVTPGSANSVGGLCAVVKTGGGNLRDALVRDATALRAALGNDVSAGNSSFRTFGFGEGLANMYARRPNSRMGAVWELRKALFDAQQRGSQGKASPLLQVLNGDLPLRIHARIENDIRAALTIAAEFKLPRVILDECSEGYLVADEIAARRFPVVLGPFLDPQGPTPEGEEICLNTAGILADRGIKIAFGSNGRDPGQLRAWATLAARSGLKPETALRALTLDAAAIAGVADRVGSIEPRKDADLLILSGEPLALTSRVQMVIVNGRVVWEEAGG